MTRRPSNVERGRRGEDLAVDWYRRQGFEILDRNWQVPRSHGRGELDLIARRGSTVVIGEVKARSSDRFGHGVEAVTWDKQRRIRRLAGAWIELVGRPLGLSMADVRCDVIDIDGDERLTVYEAAF